MLVGSGLSISDRWSDIWYFFLSVLYILNSVKICLTVRGTPQHVQIVGSSLIIKWEWVRKVWPILRWVMVVSCFLEVLGGKREGWTDFLTSFSLVVILFHSHWHRSDVSSWMIFFMSLYEKRGNVIASGAEWACLAALSACSVLSMLLYYPIERIFWKFHVVKPKLSINRQI